MWPLPEGEEPLSIPGDGRFARRRGPRVSSTGCRGWGVAAGSRWPALTPGGGPGPSPHQGQRCGAVPRNGLQGPRTKRPHWGRRASGPAARAGLHFLGTLGILFVGQAPLLRGQTPRQWWMLESYLKASFSLDLHICPSFPQFHWAGQGTRLPNARLQHKAGPGEGKSQSGSTRVEAARPPGRPSAGTRLFEGSTTSAQKLGSCGSRVLRGQLPGTSRCQLGPAPFRQPTESPRAPPPPADPRPRAGPAPLLGQRARLLPRGLRCAQTRLRQRSRAPGLGGSGLN